MKTKLKSYVPFWIALMVPPLILLTLVANFISATFGLMVVLFILNTKDAFIKNSKYVKKIWMIALVIDILTLLLFLIPELFYKIPFFNNNLIYPLEHNPYSNIWSILYVVIIAILLFFLLFKMLRKRIVSHFKASNKKEKYISIVLTLFIFPYLFFVPTTLFMEPEKSSLEDFKGTLMKNKNDIVTIMKYLKVSDSINSYILDTRTEPYTIHLYLKELNDNYYLLFEEDAAIMFNLIDDVNEIIYHFNKKEYKYYINDINAKFLDIKSKTLNDINNEYTKTIYSAYKYYGMINKYSVFDPSLEEEKEYIELFDYSETKYYIYTASLDNIIIYYKGTTYTLKRALEECVISQREVFGSKLDILSKYELDNMKK